MGGVVDYGVGLDIKTSPRGAAIEKAQAELRQEYDVREERKRELEFLEKGGNPLDFKFGHAASTSLQSTSLVDQRAEQYAISEAKGSFALAASPHGDSIESSGRPAESVGKETNTADNLLLFDGENSNPAGEKNVKRIGKRGNVSLLEQSSEGGGSSHAKETEDSLIFHLGVKNQAYARRNRSRTSRDSHSNKSTAPSSLPDHQDGNRSIREPHTGKHGVSHVSNSKPASSKGDVLPKASTIDSKSDMELDGVQTDHASVDKMKDGLRDGETEVNLSETVQNKNLSSQHTNSPGEKVAKDEATSVVLPSVALESTGSGKDNCSLDRVNGSNAEDKAATGVLDSDISKNNCDIDSTTDVQRLSNVETETHAENGNIAAGNAIGENCVMVRSEEVKSIRECKESSLYEKTLDNKGVRENGLLVGVGGPSSTTDGPKSVNPNLNNPTARIKDEVESYDNRVDTISKPESLKTNGETVSKPEKKLDNSLADSSHSINKAGVITSSLVVSTCEPSPAALSKKGNSTPSAVHINAANQLKLAKKAREDAILKEARVIEANLKMTAQLSSSYKSSEKRRKCHWDFVLEEMAWLANDFMQERLWKTAAAAHICHCIASNGRSEFEQNIIRRNQKNIAGTLAKAVMHFWHSSDAFQTTEKVPNNTNGECNTFESCEVNGEAEKDQDNKKMEAGNISLHPSIQSYAVRFLKYDRSTSTSVLAEAPPTPDRVNDAGILEKTWDSEVSEGSLFYTVRPGAMQAYREAVESQWLNYKKMVSPMNQEDYEASPSDSLPGSYFLPRAFEGNVSSKFTLQKKKILQQKYGPRAYNVGNDFSYDSCLEGKLANRPLMITGKRPSSVPNAGPIPTKRVRTATRQRLVSPFGAGTTGSLQITNKMDVSSGDNNSLQDDQSSMHGGSQSRKTMEVESTADFERQFPYDGSEASTKYKKKKSKHFGYSMNLSDPGVLVVSGKDSMFDQRLQAESTVQQEQRDQVKRRLENQHHEANGNIGIYGQHVSKKPKVVKQLTEPAQEPVMPASGSLPSPVTSQMSNMTNQNKFIKIISNRDRGKKSKTMKIAAAQSGSGIAWTTFEDQALVVFVHDMGPNWELVSDAINSTLQFKCIFRKPKECKERHKCLMDKSAGDGADSAEDSGSSQPYPLTIPGIPKGSARQLFQRLQGPMEEDTLKAHFEKIILVGQKLHSCRSQKDTQELKQMTPVHSSHFVALSQTCPNNLGGGFLSPLDLCDAISSSPDVLSLGYQSSHTSGVAIPSHQGSPVLPTSSVNAMLPGTSGGVVGSNLQSPSTPLNPPARDAQRYCMPRAASLPVDDQQKMHYSQMLSGRNMQQSTLSAPGALPMGVDRGANMLPSGNGMGMMGARTMPLSRPGFQGIISPGMPMVSAGSVLAGSGAGVSNPVNIHPGAVSGPGNSMLRTRPSQNTEDHRQMMMQDLSMQVSQGNGQAVPPFSAMSAPFSTTTGLPSVQSYPAQQQQQQPHHMTQQPHMLGNPHHPHIQSVNHSSPQQQAYAMRLAKERQLQQRMMPQAPQPYSPSSAMSAVQSTQLQQQSQPSPSATPPPSQAQHGKQQMPRNSHPISGMQNQMMKQRQRQQAQLQQPRNQQQQKQLLQQQAKLAKGLGGGTMQPHQNLSVDPSQVSGMPVGPRNQVSDKHLIQQGSGFFPGSSVLNSTLPQSANHHKLYARPPPQPSKQIPPLPSHSDQSLMPVPSSHTLIAPQQPPHPSSIPLAAPSAPHQQRHMNQNMPRMMQQNRQLSSDGRMQSLGDQVQVNHMIPATSLPRSDSTSSAPLVSPAVQWNPEPSYDTNSPNSTANLAGSPIVGIDASLPSSSEGSAHRQFSGNVKVDGNGVGGQRKLQQESQSQLQLQQQQQSQHPLRQGVQGNLYSRPSNSGPG
ncbi:chromatin modification-related protein EAF1 B-like isoform X2 [Asparagus officinalis]|uniref:chromatin modification-related protein EAF1 B-like isoform X2 n=1 Tax=Asparagus officinalis TaxID=4686 RepID=UPI00098E60D1|nr:chromatin modification-related protein EAF1 B-like isoform X2 [Asparagus officinalis]